uniref:Uncharacterized protein n=1 Tax=Anas platyrhynchos platyrhynchos TaxID=8840 RepID=A0A493TT81_ANAPP
MLPTIFFLELLFKTTAFLRDCCSSNRFRAPKLFLFQTKTTSAVCFSQKLSCSSSNF